VNVGGLLANDWSDEARDPAELDLDAKVRGFVVNAADRKGVFALPGDEETNQARLFGGRDHGEMDWRGRGIEVQ
jgi:hypothetical protein